MEGITSAAVRGVLASYGPLGMVCTEFVRVAGDRISEAHFRRQVLKLPGVALRSRKEGSQC